MKLRTSLLAGIKANPMRMHRYRYLPFHRTQALELSTGTATGTATAPAAIHSVSSSSRSASNIPPPSVNSIPTGIEPVGSAGAFIRNIGCTRRVFLSNPYLSSTEIEGLAHRIKVLVKNPNLNSVFITAGSTDGSQFGDAPSCALELDMDFELMKRTDETLIGGYDPLAVYTSGMYQDEASIQRLLDGIGSLAQSIRGNFKHSRIPALTLPEGHINDGGYAFCMGSYVLAAPDTYFSITNPSRGLSFDPIGFTFILPRLGWEYNQPCAKFPGCGMILALTGMKINAADMVETGLATHKVETDYALGTFERALSQTSPWEQQGLNKRRPLLYGQPESSIDVNAEYRNKAVACLVESFSDYAARGVDFLSDSHAQSAVPTDDPSLDLDHFPWHAFRSSDLVNYGATFNDIFLDRSVQRMIERLHHIGDTEAKDEEEEHCHNVAKDMAKRIETQSPLAIRVMHRLMELGQRQGQTLESCMERERQAQYNMLKHDDFKKWAEHSSSSTDSTNFNDWTHKRFDDVTENEIQNIIGYTKA